jgi:hypothetical protein
VQGQADPGSDDGAVDADVLQVVPEQQFELGGRLGGVPPLDGARHQAGELVVELLGQGPGSCFGDALEAVLEAAVRSEAPTGRGQHIGKPAAQLRGRVAGLGAQLFLAMLPQRRGQVAQARAAENVPLDLLAALPQLRRCLEAVREPGEPLLERQAGLVTGIGGYRDQLVA